MIPHLETKIGNVMACLVRKRVHTKSSRQTKITQFQLPFRSINKFLAFISRRPILKDSHDENLSPSTSGINKFGVDDIGVSETFLTEILRELFWKCSF